MTDLEKRADEYADKRARAYNMPKSSFVIPLLKVAYKTGATQETALLSQHILDLQKDKGNLTDKVRELEQQIEKMRCCGNCKKLKCRFDSKTNINILYCSDSDMKQIEVGFQMCCCKWEIKEK